jgi:hypothetical protein
MVYSTNLIDDIVFLLNIFQLNNHSSPPFNVFRPGRGVVAAVPATAWDLDRGPATQLSASEPGRAKMEPRGGWRKPMESQEVDVI